MTETRYNAPQPVDILQIEREARQLRARATAEMAQAALAWLRARLTGSPDGHKA